MPIFHNIKNTLLTSISLICGSAILVISILDILGWINGNEILTSFGEGYIPMAPTTAILFLIISISYLLITLKRGNQSFTIVALTAAVILIGFSLPMLILNFFNVHPAFETMGFAPFQKTAQPHIGHMSAVTAALFTLCGSTVLILVVFRRSFFSGFLPPFFSGITLLISMILLLGYIIGNPLLYQINQIPVALNTAIAFAATGIILTIESARRKISDHSQNEFKESTNIHAFSMIIAIIITGILFFGYINMLTIFKNIQESVKNKLELVAGLKANEISNYLIKGGDPGKLDQFLKWPLPNETGSIRIIADGDSTLFNGHLGGVTEAVMADGKKYEICITGIPDTHLLIISIIEKSVAFKPMVTQFIQVTTLIVCLLALTLTVLILFNRQTKLRFYRDQVLSAEKLQIVEDQFRNAFEHSSVGKTMEYIDGRYLVNQAFADMIGYSVEEVNLKSWREITHPDDQQLSQESMKSMINGENTTDRFEKRYLHKEGHSVWVDLQSYLQRDIEGKPLYFITSASNITEYKILQEQLIQSKEEAEMSNKLKDAFIANISHEIRTPLNAIIGFTDLISDEMEEQKLPGYEGYFEIIRNSGHRLTRTVDMILNLSRLQVGEYEPHISEIDLDYIIRGLFSEYQLAAQKKGVQITYENPLGKVKVESDEYCLTHSISNLIDNAVKYTQKGTISLKVYRNLQDCVCFEVKDTGIGISEEFMTQVFRPFTQEEPGSTRRFEGIGLGLSIAYRLLSVTGASIDVTSNKGKGTVFTITFPQS